MSFLYTKAKQTKTSGNNTELLLKMVTFLPCHTISTCYNSNLITGFYECKWSKRSKASICQRLHPVNQTMSCLFQAAMMMMVVRPFCDASIFTFLIQCLLQGWYYLDLKKKKKKKDRLSVSSYSWMCTTSWLHVYFKTLWFNVWPCVGV